MHGDPPYLLLSIIHNLARHPVIRLFTELNLTANQPGRLFVPAPDIGAGTAGAEQVGIQLADNDGCQSLALIVSQRDLFGFRFGAVGFFEFQSRVAVGIAGFPLDNLEFGDVDDRAFYLLEFDPVIVFLI